MASEIQKAKLTALGAAIGLTEPAPDHDLEITDKDIELTFSPPVDAPLRTKLRAPLPKAAIKPHPTKSWMSSINGAYIIERLNDCFGEDGWYAEYQVIENKADTKMVVIKAVFRATHPAGKIYREAFGGNDNPDRGDAYKGACTDALGKIASQLGIAGEVYKGMLDEVQAPAEKGKREAKKKFEAITGRVTDLRNQSPNVVWIQLNHNDLWARTVEVKHADQLRKSLGCKVEATAFWEKFKGKKGVQDIMTITAVHGVFEAVPRTEYVAKPEDESQEDEHLSPDML